MQKAGELRERDGIAHPEQLIAQGAAHGALGFLRAGNKENAKHARKD